MKLTNNLKKIGGNFVIEDNKEVKPVEAAGEAVVTQPEKKRKRLKHLHKKK